MGSLPRLSLEDQMRYVVVVNDWAGDQHVYGSFKSKDLAYAWARTSEEIAELVPMQPDGRPIAVYEVRKPDKA